MDKVYEITRIYTSHVIAEDEPAARKLERVTYEDHDARVIVKQLASKVSPETLAKIIEAAE